MERTVETEWKHHLSFESQMDGRKITIDAHPDFGGEDQGPSPETLLLASLNSCAGMDIVSLFQKMRVQVDHVKIKSIGALTHEHPRHFASIHMVYEFTGKHLRREKINQAVLLSQGKYCGISYMLEKVTNLTHEIKYRDLATEVLQMN